jgi:very-short-patch-repair endonuclease
MDVLKNNGFEYIHEKPVDRYFLDFAIECNGLMIDLEIDGRQHTYEDRVRHDNIRDRYLRSVGYIVYRIAWNEINSRRGSLRMKYKINQFLWWYDRIRSLSMVH